MDKFLKFIFGIKLYRFRTVHLSIISLRAGSGWNAVPSWSCSQAVSKPVWHIPLLCVQWKTPDDGQMNCPKPVEFYSKNKFEKFVHLVGFIIRTKEYYVHLDHGTTLIGNLSRTFHRLLLSSYLQGKVSDSAVLWVWSQKSFPKRR